MGPSSSCCFFTARRSVRGVRLLTAARGVTCAAHSHAFTSNQMEDLDKLASICVVFSLVHTPQAGLHPHSAARSEPLRAPLDGEGSGG